MTDMKRQTIPKRVQLQVWKRDNWSCRYCGTPVFFTPTLKLLNRLSPNHGYYHPNGKAGKLLPLFQWGWASVDHVKPHAKGGADSEHNYVTACWKCNLRWRDKTHADGKPRPRQVNRQLANIRWDGLSSLYAWASHIAPVGLPLLTLW